MAGPVGYPVFRYGISETFFWRHGKLFERFTDGFFSTGYNLEYATWILDNLIQYFPAIGMMVIPRAE